MVWSGWGGGGDFLLRQLNQQWKRGPGMKSPREGASLVARDSLPDGEEVVRGRCFNWHAETLSGTH